MLDGAFAQLGSSPSRSVVQLDERDLDLEAHEHGEEKSEREYVVSRPVVVVVVVVATDRLKLESVAANAATITAVVDEYGEKRPHAHQIRRVDCVERRTGVQHGVDHEVGNKGEREERNGQRGGETHVHAPLAYQQLGEHERGQVQRPGGQRRATVHHEHAHKANVLVSN